MIRCKHIVKDTSTKRYRRCKRKINANRDYCKQHDIYKYKIGQCCFCGFECNPCSQCCGRCARNMLFIG